MSTEVEALASLVLLAAIKSCFSKLMEIQGGMFVSLSRLWFMPALSFLCPWHALRDSSLNPTGVQTF